MVVMMVLLFMMILIRMSIIDEADLFIYDVHLTHQLTIIFCFKFVSKNTERVGCLRPLRLVKTNDMIYL